MVTDGRTSATLLGFFIFLGLGVLGYLLADAAVTVKSYDRSVTVKGLAEHEYVADVVIWPIQFTAADNDLEALYGRVEANTRTIIDFLEQQGIKGDEITRAIPSITDKSAQQYGQERGAFRYTAVRSVTVYSKRVDAVRSVMGALSELGKKGVVLTGDNYQAKIEYLFTRLNEVKPSMIEEATRNAREVAEKFAADSQSRLGKIRKASQGQFSINDRDKNNPHIKKVRVVSTVEYYLSD